MGHAITFLVLLFSTLFSLVTSESHPHKGKVTPFQPGDPKVKLDGKALSILKQEKPYQTQVKTGSSGRGMVVQDVKAPTSVVWGRILDYDNCT